MRLALVAMMAVLSVPSCESRVSQRDVAREREKIAAVRDCDDRVSQLERDVGDLANQLREARQEANNLRQKIGVKVMLAAVTGRRPRLIVFTAPEWCVPCQHLDQEIDRLGMMAYFDKNGARHLWSEDIGPEEDNSIQVVDCSDDDSDGAKFAAKMAVGTYPTTVRVDRDGNQVNRYTGVLDSETLCRWQAGKWVPPVKKDQIAGK